MFAAGEFAAGEFAAEDLVSREPEPEDDSASQGTRSIRSLKEERDMLGDRLLAAGEVVDAGICGPSYECMICVLLARVARCWHVLRVLGMFCLFLAFRLWHVLISVGMDA